MVDSCERYDVGSSKSEKVGAGRIQFRPVWRKELLEAKVNLDGNYHGHLAQ